MPVPVDTLDMHAAAQRPPGGMNGQAKVLDARSPEARRVAREIVLGPDPTPGYRGRPAARAASEVMADLPAFTLQTVEQMLFDPVVRFGLDVRDAALSLAEVEVLSGNVMLADYIAKVWDRLWSKYYPLFLETKRYGHAAFQIDYEIQDNLVVPKCVKSFAPTDTRPLTSPDHGLVGVSVRPSGKWMHGTGTKRWIPNPRALWLTFDSRWENVYGRSIMLRSFSPWWSKWMDHGVEQTIHLRMIKDAYRGDHGFFPEGKYTDTDGTQIGYGDLMRESLEHQLNGASTALPDVRDENGQRTLEIMPPTELSSPTGIWEWGERTDRDIWRGLSVFKEVIEAAETGSGFSGRSIPLMMFLQTVTVEFVEILSRINEQILRPLAFINFGTADYDVRPKSLIEQLSEDTGGTAMGGQIMGGSAGNPTNPGGDDEMEPGDGDAQDLADSQPATSDDRSSGLGFDASNAGDLSVEGRAKVPFARRQDSGRREREDKDEQRSDQQRQFAESQDPISNQIINRYQGLSTKRLAEAERDFTKLLKKKRHSAN